MYEINYFLNLFKYYWANLKAYPIRLITNIFWMFFGFVPQFFLWYVIAQTSNNIPYSLKEIILYFLFVWGLFYNLNVINKHFKSISSGEISINVIKPIRLTNMYFYHFFSQIIIDKLINIIIVSLIGFIVIGIQNTLLGLILFLIGLILGSLFYVIIFFSMFWLKNNWGIKFSIDIIVMYCSGLWIPLDLLPVFWQNIIELLPFKLMFYYPTKVFLGQINISVGIILQYIFWICILYIIARILEYIGLKNYEQFGG